MEGERAVEFESGRKYPPRLFWQKSPKLGDVEALYCIGRFGVNALVEELKSACEDDKFDAEILEENLHLVRQTQELVEMVFSNGVLANKDGSILLPLSDIEIPEVLQNELSKRLALMDRADKLTKAYPINLEDYGFSGRQNVFILGPNAKDFLSVQETIGGAYHIIIKHENIGYKNAFEKAVDVCVDKINREVRDLREEGKIRVPVRTIFDQALLDLIPSERIKRYYEPNNRGELYEFGEGI